MNCTNYCNSGRLPCPSPHACGLTPRKLHTRNSDGSSSRSEGSATAPMPITMEDDEADQVVDRGLTPGAWFLCLLAAMALVVTLAMLAGYVSVRLG